MVAARAKQNYYARALLFLLVCVAILISAIPFQSTAFATPQFMAPASASIDLTPFVDLLEDPTGTLTPEQVRQSTEFKPAGKSAPTLGYTKSIWWTKFTLQNNTNEHAKQIVQFCDSGEGIPNIDFFVETETAGKAAEVRTYSLGGSRPLKDRPIDNNFFAIPIDMPAQSTTSIITRIQGDSVRIPFVIHSQESFAQDLAQSNLYAGIVYGILIITILYNITIFAVLRDINYAYYVGFVLCLTAVIMAIDGFSAQRLFPNMPTINLHTVNVGSSLGGALLLKFSLSFLNIKKYYPKLVLLVYSIITLLLLNATTNAFIKFNFITNVLVTTSLLAAIIIGIIGIRNTPKLAMLFLLPFSLFALGAILTALKQAAVLPLNMLTTEGLRVGVAVNVSLWSQALAYRLRFLIGEKHAAERLLAEGQKREHESKIQALQTNLKLVAQVSDKLNSPLLSIMHTTSKMIRTAADPKCNLNKKQCASTQQCPFFAELQTRVTDIETAAKCLHTLSKTLADMREEQGNTETTTLISLP